MTRSRRPRSPRGSGEQLRSEILAAAAELLHRTGSAEAVSIREIGRMVGVTAPSIYRHFADKDALIEAVVVQVFEELDAAMHAAIDPADPPTTRMRELGLTYIRFALEHPEQYRIATAPAETAGAVDLVFTSGPFRHFSTTVEEAMSEGLIEQGDPVPIVLELWAAAHGIAALLLAKPYLPWGDPMVFAARVLDSACAGHVVTELMGRDATPAQMTRWLMDLRADKRRLSRPHPPTR